MTGTCALTNGERMDRLSGLDASFLYLETPAQLMHVCGVIVLDPSTMPDGYCFDAFQRGIDRRIRDVPDFTRKLRRVPLGLDHPVWVRDNQFDIERHVHRLALPSPGGYAELTQLCSHLAGASARPVAAAVGDVGDRGLPADDDGDERVAVFSKMHHATVDGVSGANLISHLCSLEPDAAAAGLGREEGRSATSPTPRRAARPRPGQRTLTRPLNAVKLLAPSLELVTKTVGRARAGTAMAAPLTAPRTSFNGTITGHRAIALAEMSLDDIQEIKSATGHDRQRRRARRRRRRAALLPRGPRRAADRRCWRPCRSRSARVSKREDGANKVSALFTKLGTDTDDPLERLEDMAEQQPQRQGPPQRDQRRLAPGLGRVRRAAHLRPRGAGVRRPPARREAPGRAQPGDLQRPRPAGAALLHGRRDRRRSTRSARSSTAPASTSP